MPTDWSTLEVAKLFVSLVTPFAVVFVGYWITRQLNASERKRDSEREERRAEIERRYTPHIELSVECQFYGPREGQFLAVFSVIANNKGQVVHKFPNVMLRVRGIKDEPFRYLEKYEPRADFPHKILEADIVPPKFDFIFVEPGVSHQITFTTVIPAEYTFVVAHARFEYKKYWPHTAEAVFAVPKNPT